MRIKDLVDIFEDLASGEIPLYTLPKEFETEVYLPKYEKPEAKPVKRYTRAEIEALERSRAG